MNAKGLILIIAAFLLGSVANATSEIDFAMQLPSPQASLMDVGSDAETMNAVLQTMYPSIFAGGRMLHIGWYDGRDDYRQSFVLNVAVSVPSKLPGFATLKEAMGADVRVRISHNGVAFAECLLAVEPVVSRSAVHFAVDMTALWDDVKPNRGICDIDLNATGLQAGIPVLGHKDLLTTYVKDRTYEDYDFLEGYCY